MTDLTQARLERDAYLRGRIAELEAEVAAQSAARDAAEAKAKHNFNAWRAAENEMLAVAAQRDRLAAALRETIEIHHRTHRGDHSGPYPFTNCNVQTCRDAAAALSVLDRETPDE